MSETNNGLSEEYLRLMIDEYWQGYADRVCFVCLKPFSMRWPWLKHMSREHNFDAMDFITRMREQYGDSSS